MALCPRVFKFLLPRQAERGALFIFPSLKHMDIYNMRNINIDFFSVLYTLMQYIMCDRKGCIFTL